MPKDTTKKKVSKKEKKGFFKDFKGELKKVNWLTPKQVVNNTVAVLTIVLITAAIVAVLDIAFEKTNTFSVNGLKKMKENHNEQVVDDESKNEETVENETETEGISEKSETVENEAEAEVILEESETVENVVE
ncbi:MAG: preprotein translocase subunit SecE [Clostridia bacterium]|nr:preprotein translocase subunit SecE [Clostridia bacterium]